MTTPTRRLRLNPTIKTCVTRVLGKRKGPQHYVEVTKQVLAMRPIVGKTPQNSVYAVLNKDNGIFKALGGGMFLLRRK